MSTESIQSTLQARFAAPLPEFYQRRILFWHDEDGEFADLVDSLDLPGVTVVKRTGSNNFAIKKLLLHDDPQGNYLIYDPFSYAHPQDNWLLDMEKYSESFRADYTSLLMEDLHIEPSPPLRKTMKRYATFFANKERVDKLRRLGRESYQTPLQLHIVILAVLAGQKKQGSTAQDVLQAVLSGGLEEEDNAPLNQIKKFGDIEVFWQLARKYTGYLQEEDKPLGFFAAHVLLTAQAQTMPMEVWKGLERFVSQSNTAYCYSLVSEWRERGDRDALWALCRSVEQELRLPERFDKLEVETLLTGDIFPAIHESILKRFFQETAEQVVKIDGMLKAAEHQRTAGWYLSFAPYYECLYAIAKMQAFYRDHSEGFHLVEPKAVWKLYTETAWEMDRFYRQFHTAFGASLKDSNVVLEDKLKGATDYVEGLYQNWFLQELTRCWTTAAEEELAHLGYLSEIGRQRDFYTHYVRPLTGKGGRVFVILSDALRFEVAEELSESLPRTTKGTVKLEAVQSMFPSITKFGMAALLPGKTLSVTEDMHVFVDGMPTRTTADREKILCASNPNSVAVQYGDIIGMKRAQRRELIQGKEVVYIYHNTIDAIGDKAPTEQKVFEACTDALEELAGLVRVIVNDMQGTDILITADHGFLYTYRPLTEGDKVGREVMTGTIYEIGRRYALTSLDAQAEHLLPVQRTGVLEGFPLNGYTPRDATRIKVSGGGENYVHGGVSLQEMVVPVIAFKNLRSKSKQYVEVKNAGLKLLSESRKITNLLFSLDFLQEQPVGDKIQPCTYTIYMTDGEGVVVSDRQTVIADRTSANASERVFRVRFNLKAGTYDRKQEYRLVIANGTDVPEEVGFQIDVAFADDFGFDL